MEAKTLLSAEDVLAMGNIGRWELVKGELIKMNPADGEHGRLAMSIGAILLNFVRTHKLGEVFGAETGLYTERDPDTLRAANAMYYSTGRMIWVVNPRTKSVHVYRPGKEVRRLSDDDHLVGEDVLPGFEVSVAELFE